MGRFCLEHEPHARRLRRPSVTHVAQVSALVAAGIVGAAVRARLGR